MLFRYGDFVQYFGGDEFHLGVIVGIGNIGALVTRLALGVQIDRHGPRVVWMAGLVGLVLSLIWHISLASVHAPPVFLARLLLSSSLAAIFGASITYVSLLAPKHRMAELVGVLGSSGFIGQAVGPALGDLLYGSVLDKGLGVAAMFTFATLLTIGSLVLVYIGTHTLPREEDRHDDPSWWELLREHHPGILLVMGVAVAIGLGIPSTFLAPYSKLHHIPIWPFFIVYSVTAFGVRVFARRLTDEWGVYPVVLGGMSLLAGGTLLFLVIDLPGLAALAGPAQAWLLAIPAVVAGVAHAFLFPAIVAGGSAAFPDRHRGLGTTLILSTFDIGNLLGPPLVGAILVGAERIGLPSYVTMFPAMTGLLLAVTAAYSWLGRPVGHVSNVPEHRE
jgi:MFS family permease